MEKITRIQFMAGIGKLEDTFGHYEIKVLQGIEKFLNFYQVKNSEWEKMTDIMIKNFSVLPYATEYWEALYQIGKVTERDLYTFKQIDKKVEELVRGMQRVKSQETKKRIYNYD